jgi:PAS domain S-box-containing protein
MAQAERAVALNSEGRFRTLTEKSADVIMITDELGKISYISPSVNSQLGWNDHGLRGSNAFEKIHPDDVALARAAMGAIVTLAGSSTIGVRVGHANGEWLDFTFLIRNLVHDPNIRGVLINARDVTQDKRAQEVVDFNASHDVLTKLPNRAVFYGPAANGDRSKATSSPDQSRCPVPRS